MRILFKYATRSRPELFERGILSILQNVVSDDYHILVSTDFDDKKMHTYHQIQMVNGNDHITWIVGNSKNKVDAINRDINKLNYDWDILVNMSDDMVFTKKGFDEDIRNAFDVKGETIYSQYLRTVEKDGKVTVYNLDQCLHFPDQNQGANCMTMSIMGIDYYKRDNFIYNPAFESLWCDIVAQEVAQIRGCYKYVPINIFNHLHPSFGQAEYDSQYRSTEAWEVRQRDYNTYLKLKSEYDPNNIFPIRSI